MDIIASVQTAYPGKLPVGMAEQYTEMEECKAIYQRDPPWKLAKRGGLSKQADKKRTRAMLHGAKVLVDELSALTFCEQVNISVGDETADQYLQQTLQQNGFWDNMPNFLSMAYALGGGVLKVFADQGKPCIDYLPADCFAPLGFDGKHIFDGVFQTYSAMGDHYFTLLERHFQQNAMPCVENKLYRSPSNTELGQEVDLGLLYEDLPPLVEYEGLTVPMFHYFKPAVSNNLEVTSPLGLSAFSNAKATLEGLDIAFDSLIREFILGKKRVIVPTSCIRTVMDIETGESTRYFDTNDEVYEAMKCDEENDLKITDNTMELRVDEHVSAINTMLNLLCFQTGLSAGTLSFDGSSGVKTATEIISEDSKTARTMKQNKNLLAETVQGLCQSVLALGHWLGTLPQADYAVTVTFADNIVIDDNTRIDNNIKLVSAGLKSKLSAIMEVLGCDKVTAQAELTAIIKEQQVNGLAVDDLFGGVGQ